MGSATHTSVAFCPFHLAVQMLLPQHHYCRPACLLSKALTPWQALPHCSQACRAGLPPGRDGTNHGGWKCLSIQMLFGRRRLHAHHLTQQVKGSFLTAMLPNSPVKQHSSLPSAQPASLCSSLKLWLTAVQCPASPGSVICTSLEKAKFKLYIIFLHVLFFKTDN